MAARPPVRSPLFVRIYTSQSMNMNGGGDDGTCHFRCWADDKSSSPFWGRYYLYSYFTKLLWFSVYDSVPIHRRKENKPFSFIFLSWYWIWMLLFLFRTCMDLDRPCNVDAFTLYLRVLLSIHRQCWKGFIMNPPSNSPPNPFSFALLDLSV